MSNFNPCVEIPLFFSPTEMLLKSLKNNLHEGAFWTRAEYSGYERYEIHFTVLNATENVEDTKLLIHDGNHAGEIMSLYDLETLQLEHKFETVSYWPVMDDEIDRVRFSPPR